MKISVHNKTLVLFLSQLLSLLVSKACHSVDKQALLHFKHNIISDPSKLLHSWSLSSDCCSAWEGVACDPSGRLKSLIYLDLSGNRISGRLPQSIVAVSQLGLLYLSHNQLNGSIPCSISGLNSLLFCQLSQNKLAGALPASPGQLPKIERLFFENNKLSGKLPAIIGHLAILTDIFFSNNRFTGKIPSSFSNLHNLQTVDLSTNRFIGQIPPQLAKLQRLDTLDLSFNPLGLISVPSFFARLKLFRLSLEKTGIEGQLPYLHHLSPYLTYQAIP
ncbi:hypothetical protein ACFX13_018660 [Malus domestica]